MIPSFFNNGLLHAGQHSGKAIFRKSFNQDIHSFYCFMQNQENIILFRESKYASTLPDVLKFRITVFLPFIFGNVYLEGYLI
jgi:hypothetical protein